MASSRAVRIPDLKLRGRLTLLIAVIVVAAVATTFVAVYRGTGAELRGGIERDLSGQADGLGSGIRGAGSSRDAAARARRYISTQPFGASSRLLIVKVPGQPVVTNEPQVLGVEGTREKDGPGERSREHHQVRALDSAPIGFSTVEVEDVGEVRLLSRVIRPVAGRPVVARVGEPLAPVERAQDGVARTVLLAGSLTLLAALVAGYLVAARVSAPLRRIARTAAEVDAGELSRRIGASGPRDEVRALAESFDHMLDRLEEAFAGQRAFVADASHELRTPLTVIRGQLEVLARHEHPPPEEVKRVAQLVATEVVRMQRLVDDLLLLARGDEGLVPHTQRVDARSLLTELVDVLRATTDRRFEIGPIPEGDVEADPQLLAQVLRNLLRNAIEHTDPGGLVAVHARRRGTLLEVAVDDDGAGIPAEEAGRVFDRFHRTDASRTRAAGGSGLGLAIARSVVEAHGGRIWAGRGPEGGARVAFELPSFSPKPESRRVPAGTRSSARR